MIGRPLCHLLADCSDEVPYFPILYSGQPTMEDGSVVRVKSLSPLTCRLKIRHLTILLEHLVCALLLLLAQPGTAMEPCAIPGQLKSAKKRIRRSFEEMADLFDTKDVNQSASSFNPEKLLWIDQQHIIATPVNKLGKAMTPFLLAG